MYYLEVILINDPVKYYFSSTYDIDQWFPKYCLDGGTAIRSCRVETLAGEGVSIALQ